MAFSKRLLIFSAHRAVHLIVLGRLSFLTVFAAAGWIQATASASPPTVLPSASPTKTYVPKYSTIGHTILRQEEVLGMVTSDTYRKLDALLDDAKLLALSSDTTPEALAQNLARIDSLLTRHGFVFVFDEGGRTLGEALAPHILDQSSLAALAANPSNARRRTRLTAHAQEPFYHLSRSTACLLYLSIADALQLPLAMSLVPGHFIIRWYASGDSYLNWETAAGTVASDRDYRKHLIFDDPIRSGALLSRLTPQEVLGYSHHLVGYRFADQHRSKDAVAEFTTGAALYPRYPYLWNSLAWEYATSRDSTVRNGAKAVASALKAAAILSSDQILDTLACAYAEAGDFDKAIELETQAYTAFYNPEFQTRLAGFQEHKTYLQQPP